MLGEDEYDEIPNKISEIKIEVNEWKQIRRKKK